MTYRTDKFASGDFAKYCNSLPSGHLKEWKAESMMSELSLGNYQGEALINWIHGCLGMEGFSSFDCDKIVEYLANKAD